MNCYVIDPYKLYPITRDRRPRRPLVYSAKRLKRAHRASVGTTLAKALLRRRGL